MKSKVFSHPAISFFVVLAFFVVSPALVSAVNLYVSPVGSDSNVGSLLSPLRTISRAATLARSGDRIQVRGGVYNEIVKINSIGSSGAWIIFESYPGETAVVDGNGSTADTSLVQIGGQYIEFRNFEVRNATRTGISVYGAKNVRLMNNVIHHSVRGAIYTGASAMGGVTDIHVEGNTAFNNCLVNQSHTSSSGWPLAIGASKTVRATIKGNRVYQNHGEGIGVLLTDYATVTGNTVYDNFSVQIYLDNAQFTTVDGNLIYSTGDANYYRSGEPAVGISTANESYSDSNPLTDNKIINNIVVRAKRGFYYSSYGVGGGLKNTVVANNTFYQGTTALLGISSASHVNTVISNNIFYQTGSAPISSISGSGISYHHNCWYGGSPGSAAGSGDVNSNPLFLNPGSLAAASYQLQIGSPARLKGASMAEVSSDYWKATRTVAYDMGAHEASSNATAPPAGDPADFMYVNNVAINYRYYSRRHYYKPRVTVYNQDGLPVAGATVQGRWSGALTGTYSALTNTNGTAVIKELRTSSTGAVTFTVTSVTHSGHTYDVTKNVETSATAQRASTP